MENNSVQWYEKFSRQVDELQRKMFAYDKAVQEKINEQNSFRNRNRTIMEEEDIIIKKFGGKKLDLDCFYKHLSDFIFNEEEINYLKSVSPCKIIFNFTEEVIPEEYFYSFYLISLEESQKYENTYDKEVIVYIASRDRINVYIAGFLKNHTIRSKDFDRKLSSEICYYKEGIAVYLNEIE